MKDGGVDYSKYTHEQIARALSSIDREKYPLNHAKLLAAQQALPVVPMDDASIADRERVRLLEAVANGDVWLSLPAILTFWLPCVRRAVVRGDYLEIRGYLTREQVPLTEIARVRWYDAQRLAERSLALIEFRNGAHLKLLPRSSAVMRAFAAHVGAVQGRADVADPKYMSAFFIGPADPT